MRSRGMFDNVGSFQLSAQERPLTLHESYDMVRKIFNVNTDAECAAILDAANRGTHQTVTRAQLRKRLESTLELYGHSMIPQVGEA
jgi:hypothetical protein